MLSNSIDNVLNTYFEKVHRGEHPKTYGYLVDQVRTLAWQNLSLISYLFERCFGDLRESHLITQITIRQPIIELLFNGTVQQAQAAARNAAWNRLHPAEREALCIQHINEGGSLFRLRPEDRTRAVVLAAVRRNGLELRNVPYQFAEDLEIARAAVEQNRAAIDYAHYSIRFLLERDPFITVREPVRAAR